MRGTIIAISMASLALLPTLACAAFLDASTPQSAARAIVDARAGDTVRLAPGHYGKIRIIAGQHNQVTVGKAAIRNQTRPLSGPATITSADPNNPAVLTGIETRDAPFWTFSRLRVTPNVGIQAIAIRLLSPDNVLSGNHFGYDDYQDWNKAEWKKRAARMVYSTGKRTKVINNKFTGIYHAIMLGHGADGSRAENNTIRGLGGDGFNISADNVEIIGNDMAEFFEINGNHDDCLQAWPGPRVNQAGSIRGLQVIGNRCLVHSNLDYVPASPAHPSYSSTLQGYGAFDGATADCLIKDNWGVVTAYHGINFAGATNCRYENNRVIDASGLNKTWAQVSGTKNNRRPSGNTVINNIANVVKQRPGATYAGNFTVSFPEYDRIFANWRKGDLRLITTSPAQPATPSVTLPPAPRMKRRVGG